MNRTNRTHKTTVFLLLVAISLLARAQCFAAQSLVIAPPGCCVFFHGSYNNENFFREGFAGESCYGNGQGPTITDAPDAIVANNCPYNQNAWATWPGYFGVTNYAYKPGDVLVVTINADCTGGLSSQKSDDKSDGPECPSEKCCGAAQWSVSEPQLSVWLHDEPLGYNPSAGAPRISFLLAYKQRETTAGMDPKIFSAGKQWNFSWFSFVTLDSNGSNVVHFPNGKERTFTATNDFLTNTRISGDTNSGFTVSYPDGSKDVMASSSAAVAGPFRRLS